MKPDTVSAMRYLIAQVRETIPFTLSAEQICADSCQGCSVKLLSYLENELDDWEQRLAQGERPNFGDLNRLANTSKKIHKILRQNGLIPE